MQFLYSCHAIEHLHITESIKLLSECRRVLSPDGYMRLTLPDFNFIFEILAGTEKSEFPREFRSVQGRAINHLFCDGQHKYAFSKELIEEIAEEIGFTKVASAGVQDNNVPNLQQIEPAGSFSMNLYK
jgi:predicted SAM-dependent methyltransferase